MNDLDEVEREVEHSLPKTVVKEAKRHFFVYIFIAFIVIAVLGAGGFFGFTYVSQSKKTQQQTQEQIDLQKRQLDLQSKQLQDMQTQETAKKQEADKNAQATQTAQAKTNASKPTCDAARQTKQRNNAEKALNDEKTALVKKQGYLAELNAKLTDPFLTSSQRDYIVSQIGDYTIFITDSERNIEMRNDELKTINNCTKFYGYYDK